jgi:hypothetical protein
MIAISYKPLTGTPAFLIGLKNGTVHSWSVSGVGATPTDTDISPTGYTPSDFDTPYTALINNNILYVNRPDRVPWYMVIGGVKFATLPNWDPTWRCQVLRSCGAALVAINVTKGATAYPTMVKTSDFTLFGATPGSWTAAPSNSATENVLPDLGEPLVDALALRDSMVLYSNRETWLMTQSFDDKVWNYRRIFGGKDESAGSIGANCAAQFNNVHYVFGLDDIWKHDGFTRSSISAGRVRDFIYNNMVKSQANQFFVAHNPKLNEILFCYVSVDPYCAYKVGNAFGYPGCNRAAVYNYRADTWYFYDLPYVTSAGFTTPFQGARYLDLSAVSYASIGGSYQSLSDATGLAFTMVSGKYGSVNQAVRTFELPASPVSSGTVDSAATAPVFLENRGIDLDELGKQLRMYGVVTSIYPEGRFDPGAAPMKFAFGGSDYSNVPPVYGPTMPFDGAASYKLDYTVSGRYMAMQITYSDAKSFSLSGIDFDMSIIGRR